MKKNIALFLIVFPFVVNAQFNRGQIFMGGTLSASIDNNDVPSSGYPYNGSSYSTRSISLSPILGCFLKPKLAIGGGLSYSSNYSESNYPGYFYDSNNNLVYYNNSSKTKISSISIIGFARYYINLSNSFYFVGKGITSFSRGNQNDDSMYRDISGTRETSSDKPFYSLGISLNPTLAFFPSQKWCLEASVGTIGYQVQKNLPNVSSNQNFTVSAGYISFGVTYFLKRSVM
jgi:hypothetical protein